MRVRSYRDEDLPAVTRLWYETTRDAYPYLPLMQSKTYEDDLAVMRDVIAPRCRVFLAEDSDGVAGFLAMNGSYVDRLYVHPSRQRSGIGTLLLAKAKELSPTGLELHTHQENASACAFYEKHGFRVVRFGVSPPPESAPDVEYHWRPRV